MLFPSALTKYRSPLRSLIAMISFIEARVHGPCAERGFPATNHERFCCPSPPEALEIILRCLRSQAAKQKEVVRENMIPFSIVAGIISQGDWSNGRHPTAELQYVRSAEVIDLQYFPGFAAVHKTSSHSRMIEPSAPTNMGIAFSASSSTCRE